MAATCASFFIDSIFLLHVQAIFVLNIFLCSCMQNYNAYIREDSVHFHALTCISCKSNSCLSTHRFVRSYMRFFHNCEWLRSRMSREAKESGVTPLIIENFIFFSITFKNFPKKFRNSPFPIFAASEHLWLGCCPWQNLNISMSYLSFIL